MAIQQRRGADADFDASKMLPAEIAITTDGSRKVYAAFAPGDVKELASKEDVQEIIDEFDANVAEDIQKATEEITKEATEQMQAIEEKAEEILVDVPNYEQRLAELERYKANAIIRTTTSEVPTTTDAAPVPPLNIIPYGKSEQKQLSGKQMLVYPYTESDITLNGLTFNPTNGHVSVKGTTTAGTMISIMKNIPVGSYGVKVSNVLKGMSLNVFDITSNSILSSLVNNSSATKMTFTVTEGMDAMLYLNQGSSGVVVDIDVDIMMTTADLIDLVDFEPYTNGQPSPSMAYPQPIVSVGQRYVNGYQLGDYERFSTTSQGGATLTKNEDGSITISGSGTLTSRFDYQVAYSHEETMQLIKSGTLFSKIEKVVNPYLVIHFEYANGSKSIYHASGIIGSIDITDDMLDDSCYLILRFYGDNGSEIVGGTIKPMLYQDGEGTWEQFTGGVAKVIDVGIEQKLLSGNLFDISKAICYTPERIEQLGYGVLVDGNTLTVTTNSISGTGLSDSVGSTLRDFAPHLRVGETYTLSANSTANRKEIYLKGVKTFWTFGTSKEVTEEMLNSEVLFYTDTVAGGTVAIISDIMINIGETALPFEPYKEPQPLSIPYVLREGDKIPYAEGKRVEKSKEYNLADLYWQQGSPNNNGDGNTFYTEELVGVMSTTLYCTHSKAKYEGTWENLSVDEFSSKAYGYIVLCTTHSSLEEFTTWLSDANVKALVELIYPIETDLTDEDIAQYEALVMNKGYNTLVNDAGCVTEVEYVCDTKMYIDNKFKELETALVSATAQLL